MRQLERQILFCGGEKKKKSDLLLLLYQTKLYNIVDALAK